MVDKQRASHVHDPHTSNGLLLCRIRRSQYWIVLGENEADGVLLMTRVAILHLVFGRLLLERVGVPKTIKPPVAGIIGIALGIFHGNFQPEKISHEIPITT